MPGKKIKNDISVVREIDILQPTKNQEEGISVESMIVQAIKSKVPVETMERILAMRRELKAEFAKKAYDESMAEFQAKCPTIKKTKEVKTKAGIVAYRFAPLESIVEQVAPFLQVSGFSYSTTMELLPTGVRVVVKSTHKEGHSELSPMEVPLGNKTDIMSASQVVAAAQTFAKRYAFCNAFGILTGDEDNDGQTDKLNSLKDNNIPVKTARVEPSYKQKIAHLCKLLNIPLDPFTEEKITKITGLLVVQENYKEIIRRMSILVDDKKEFDQK